MKDKPVVLDEDNINDMYKDLNTAIYMLHFVNSELFSKEEIQNVTFSLKVTLNSMDEIIEGKSKKLFVK